MIFEIRQRRPSSPHTAHSDLPRSPVFRVALQVVVVIRVKHASLTEDVGVVGVLAQVAPSVVVVVVVVGWGTQVVTVVGRVVTPAGGACQVGCEHLKGLWF